MQFRFSDSPPSHVRLHARVLNQEDMPSDLDQAVAEGARAARFKGSAGQVFETFSMKDGTLRRLALAGAGEADATLRRLNLEKAGAALAAKYLVSGESAMVLDLGHADLSGEEAAAALLGLRLRSWRLDTYRTKLPADKRPSLETVHVVGAPDGTHDAWAEAEAVARGVEFTRTLVTEPANRLYPESFVALCEKAFEGTGAELIVLDEEAMEKLGMGALLGVGQGSERASRILAIRWNGGRTGDRPSVFVGKGVTFDTGGISLKPPPGMEDMKWDMGGAGAVAGALLALAGRKAKANVIGVLGLVENMPDGKAQRPGDIVTTMSGQTVEVLNTDAEGRLVLCDALHWAQEEFDPARIVDLATLTGAMIIALGNEHGGMFANDDKLAGQLTCAGEGVGDRLWRLPLAPAYDKLIDSPIADMKNVGPREAGSITAAQFLQRFIRKGTPWAHLDIAGMVWSTKPGHTWDKGATGYGVRLIDRFVKENLE
ncbi:leucyl aminopeptidase [Erythrobacter sp. HL-111]|uniref:leucyl aminopeptidase n=1 Tax=Erythrobacter sp. HL-111 TaxID=1798193 RepID=UPI0006DBBF19|nr:leucyl aminopeptidase [Erythrobacter sp. HL-111]KPP91495.1 MAG: leucyl aminopeptidase [Erythrobacteraceae bacterium HL-111]SDS24636.1 leucyl aminopeptidase [Erythrobacter sp. HL-111]